MKKTNLIVAAGLGIATSASAVMLGANAYAAPNAAPAAPAGAVASYQVAGPVDASDPAVRYTQKGNTVTATRDGKVVATISLKSASYTKESGRIELTVQAKQPFALDTERFVLYDAEGENSADEARTIRVNAGTHTIALDFADTHRPEALGWVPQDGEDGAGVWELAGAGVVNAGDAGVTYTQSGNVVTATRNGKVIATIELHLANAGEDAAQAELTVTAKQPFTLDTDRFVVYDAEGGENSADEARTIRVDAGTHTFGLHFNEVSLPEALGWVPQDGEDAAAVWEFADHS
jgi:hypothetical protein